ncbi:hypothetical protein ACFE04_028389 [Oxalis oulophora]
MPYPPGPRGYPIIGNLTMLHQLTHRGLARLANIYGGLLHLRMGQIHVIAVSSPKVAREVLQTQDGVFSNRPANSAIKYLTYDRADMAFAHYGPFWRQMRKICVMKLFSRKRAESWTSVQEEVESTIQTLMGMTGSAVNISEVVSNLSKNITYRAAFGTSSNEGQEEFVKILQEFSRLFGAFNLGDFLPWLGWINGKEFSKRLVNARASLDGFIDKIIDDHMVKRKSEYEGEGEGEGEGEADMVDELLTFYSQEPNVDVALHNSSPKFTRDNIKALIMDVMFGGTETVASAMEWAMAELMKSPEDLKKVREELTKVVGSNRHVSGSDLENLPFFKCVIKETLRLHPPIPVLLHETAEETNVFGYKIPARAQVMINVWAIGRDPNSWTNPENFDPSRFMKHNVPDFKGSDYEFLPFGSGRRSCPGMQLGLYGLELGVASLLNCFDWELPNGMKPSELDMNDTFGLTAPKAVQLVVVPTYRF